MTSTITQIGICGHTLKVDSKFVCQRPKDHEGSHVYSDTALRVPIEPDHTYFIERDRGLFLCCYEYIQRLIAAADDKKWPKLRDGFRTRCTECKGNILLVEDTFTYELAEGEDPGFYGQLPVVPRRA